MTERGVLPGLWPIYGDGVLARQGDLVLLIHPAGGAFTDRLLDLLAEAARAGANGLGFTDLVSAQFDAAAAAADTATDRHGPAAVAFGLVGSGTAVALYGAGWAEVTTAYGSQWLTAGQPHARLRCVLPSTLIKVRAGVQEVVGEGETDPYLRLADGVVRAVALLYAPAEVRAEPADQPRPAASGRGLAPELSPAAPAADQEPPPAPAVPEVVPDRVHRVAEPHADQIQEPEPEYYATQIEPAVAPPPSPDPHAARPPPPSPDPHAAQPPPPSPDPPDAKHLDLIEMPAAMVEGVYCENEHFNDPEARYCAVCGISMGQSAMVRQQASRPPLGVLILGDGSACQLDTDYVIGREPTLDSSVADGHARPLRLVDASGVVSRIHARVELDGWQVFITDLGSANGTQVLLPGERKPTSLQPGVRTPLPAGAQIRLGGEYGLQYDSRRHR